MDAAPAAAADWTSTARARNLRLEHAAVGTAEERVLYHMELELSAALPTSVVATADNYVCLSWPYGGLWRITRVAVDRMRVWCLAWRKGHLTAQQFEKHELIIAALAMRGWILDGRQRRATHSDRSLNESHALPTVFKWKMMRGNWGTEVDHWFLKALEPPRTTDACQNQLVAKLLVDFAALEAQIEVNAVTAIDTVAQTYAADVTWQATLPAITTVQNLAFLTEFLVILEVDMAQFEFSNITELKSKQELSTSVTDAGTVHFLDTVPAGESVLASGHHERVFHLQFSQRVVAVFTDEMALRTFPFDQQKLAFELTTGTSGLPDGPRRLIPTPARPGSFAVANFHLGNVFNLAYHDKIFVSHVVEFGPRKTVVFELVLERKSTYYVKNVALVAAIITYLCFFVSWVPADKQGNAMETGTRLQNATAMVLTAVTFKNQVSSLVPQISYFTILDSYVSVCFLVTSFVTLESALYPLVEGWVGANWSETTLLGYALLLFTVMNVVWAAYLARWVYHRRQAAVPVMQVYEFIRVITAKHPAAYREEVLARLLDARKIPTWCRPHWLVTAGGDMHVLAPDDIPEDTYVTHCLVRGMRRRAAARKKNREELVLRQKQIADNATDEIEAIYTDVRWPGTTPPRQSSTTTIPTARVSDTAYQAGARQLARLASSVCALDEDVNGDEVATPRLSTQELVEEAAATIITHAKRNRRHEHADAA